MALAGPSLDSLASETCCICDESLLIPSEDELGKAEPAFVIDDVELVCGHHYHWNCIMDYAMATQNGAKDLKCTQCQAGVLHPVDHKFLVTVRNEGGVTGMFDMGQEINDEIYLDAHPEVRRNELFLSLMQEGQLEDAERLLHGDDLSGEGPINPDIVYPTGETALHMAASNDSVVAVQLLLKYGADKSRRNNEGRTALDVARNAGANNVVALL